ncbi:prepilin-type N-terminal cleavage/methylation domain-containing protein [Patescibacteria group bacterium]|nr:MAG: prepilin-type N-terminal cleavage/methylation domain-containing protein [Patescibacteria group bacterium]
MNRSKTKGFTLIELLVVIAIIGLLSTLAIIALNSARVKSRDAKRVSDIKQIQTALELYYADSSEYPIEALAVNLGNTGQLKLCDKASSGGWADACTTTTYMGQVPKDPTAAQNYAYTAASPGSTYSITFTLEGVVGSLAAGAHTATPNGIQ